MGKRHKSLREVLPLMLEQFKTNNLTLEEVSKSSGVDIKFIEALLDDENSILLNLTKLMDFANIKTSFRAYGIISHSYQKLESHIWIRRNIEPKCRVKFDYTTQRFYDLEPIQKHIKLTHTQKQNIMYDFELFKETRIEN